MSLSVIFKDVIDSWNKRSNDLGKPSPVKLLHDFAIKFRAINKAKLKHLYGDDLEGLPTFPWTELLQTLGYERIHEGRVLPNGQIIYVDGEVCRTSGRPEVWLIIIKCAVKPRPLGLGI